MGEIAKVGDLVTILGTSEYGLKNQGNEINSKYIGKEYKVMQVWETEVEVNVAGGYTLAHDEYEIVK